jgi:hypothetical protein
LVPWAAADVLLLEDFEDAAIHYTPSHVDALDDLAARDYYGRISTGFGTHLLSNLQGVMFYAAEDMDSALPVGIGNNVALDLDFSIDITNYTNLAFSIFLAKDAADDLEEDWDSSDQFLITYQIDGGLPQNLLSVEAEDPEADGLNEAPRLDNDFDGIGEGAIITDAFTQFTRNLVGMGSTLDLKIRYLSTNRAGDEDLAFDNVSITGDLVPEPTTLLLLVTAAPLALASRRRKQ